MHPAANSGYWDGKAHKGVKPEDPFDTRTVEGRKRQRKDRPTPDAPKPKWMPYAPKSSPGASGGRFYDDSGVAEAGSIKSGESFFTLPTALSTFHAVILSASKGRSRSIGGRSGSAFNQRS